MILIANLIDNIVPYLLVVISDQVTSCHWSPSIRVVKVCVRIVVEYWAWHLAVISCLARHQPIVDIIGTNRNHAMVEARMTIGVS